MSPAVLQLALDMREIVNIFISVFSLVMTVLFGSYVLAQWGAHGYRGLGISARGALGCTLLFFGEFLRSSTVWEILHFDRTKGSYATQVLPLILALVFIVVGSLYIIRIFSPYAARHWLWLISFIVAAGLAAISMVL